MTKRATFSILLSLLIVIAGLCLASCSSQLFPKKVAVVKPKRHIFPYHHTKHKNKKRTRVVRYTSN